MLRLLLVEDNGLVRRAVARSVQHSYHVTQAHDGRRALELVRSSEPFDLLLTDFAMPTLGGVGLLRALELSDARLAERCVMMTGEPREARAVLADMHLKVDLLAKPFTISDLLAALSRAATR